MTFTAVESLSNGEQHVSFDQQGASSRAGLGAAAIKAKDKLQMERSIIQSRASAASGFGSHLLDELRLCLHWDKGGITPTNNMGCFQSIVSQPLYTSGPFKRFV